MIAGGVEGVSAGGWHTLVLKQDGSVWVAGANNNGQLGEGTKTDSRFFVMAMGAFGASARDSVKYFYELDNVCHLSTRSVNII